MSFESLLKEKAKRLEDIPLSLQTTLEKEQSRVLKEVLKDLSNLDTKDGAIIINNANLKKVTEISDKLKGILLSEDYLKAVKDFSSEFSAQATLNNKIIKAGFGETDNPIASKAYLDLAKKSAVQSLVGSAVDEQFSKPITSILESAVVNGSSFGETIDALTTAIKGNDKVDSKFLNYARQITNDSFAVADRSFTSIISDALDAEWFYYSGTEIDTTRCFCAERVGKYFYYKEIEAWGDGKNLGECNIGGGKWAGQMAGTNSSTIYSYLGGYNCMHSLMPVSDVLVSDSDIERVKDLGFIE
jgi:hypothetical protein